MGWSEKQDSIIANSKGEVKDVSFKIKTDSLGNHTDIVWASKGNDFSNHAHSWGVNTPNCGHRPEKK